MKAILNPHDPDKPMMGCGHAANARTHTGDPVCVICYGIMAGATEVVPSPNLEGRVARCSDCKSEVPSGLALAFFEYRPDNDSDRFYCGCRGWN